MVKGTWGEHWNLISRPPSFERPAGLPPLAGSVVGEPADLLRSFPNPQFKLQATLGAGQPSRSWAGLGAGVGRVGEDASPKSEIVLSLETSLENKELTFQSWFHQWRVGLAAFWGSQGKGDFFLFSSVGRG